MPSIAATPSGSNAVSPAASLLPPKQVILGQRRLIAAGEQGGAASFESRFQSSLRSTLCC
jgi:hypothetical protein